MKSNIIRITILAIIGAVTLIGCGDDDCPNCPSTKTDQQGLMFAYIHMYNGRIYFRGTIRGIDGSLPDVDSVTLENHVDIPEVEIDAEGAERYLRFNLWLYQDTLTPGDTVTAYIYTPTETCSSKVRLFDRFDDAPQIYEWLTESPYDTVAAGTEIEIAWQPIPYADWYYVRETYLYNSQGVFSRNEVDFTTTDTSFIIPDSETTGNGYYIISITAGSGPYGDDAVGNIEGEEIDGIVYSSAIKSLIIYIGTGNPYPQSSLNTFNESTDQSNLREFIKHSWIAK